VTSRQANSRREDGEGKKVAPLAERPVAPSDIAAERSAPLSCAADGRERGRGAARRSR
jgi:hypothetical protein